MELIESFRLMCKESYKNRMEVRLFEKVFKIRVFKKYLFLMVINIFLVFNLKIFGYSIFNDLFIDLILKYLYLY